MKIEVKILSGNGRVPVKGTAGAAGYDLFAAENAEIYSKTRKLVKTNIAVSIPSGFYGRIAPRSGLALKHGIDVLAGVIDSDYRGDIGVILYNTDPANEFIVNKGDKIAQLIIEPCAEVEWTDVDDLSESKRGDKGYGHTG